MAAVSIALAQFPGLASTSSTRALPNPTVIFSKNAPKFAQFASKPLKLVSIPKASSDDENAGAAAGEEMTELGKEIKQAMKEKETGFVSGVVEEIREIEWPAFNKVLGTTGVVLGVIAGSTVVLLTVNAVLAQISDTIFAGKGVQDFFG